jgi:predicted HAD superfamily phosphohydrolase YqeG
MTTIAIDVDDTLITWMVDGTAIPNHNVLDLLRWFVRNKHDVIVWSGGGVEYAQRWAEKLGVASDVRVVEKGSEPVDIAIDDGGLGFSRDETAIEWVEQELKDAKVTIHV